MRATTLIASLAVVAIAQKTEYYADEIDDSLDGYDHHLFVRRALADDIAHIEAEHGEYVDTSLEGYDHALVARELLTNQDNGDDNNDTPAEAQITPRDLGLGDEATRKLGRMEPHYVKPYVRSALSEDLAEVLNSVEDPSEVDVSLDGYDHDLIARTFDEYEDEEEDVPEVLLDRDAGDYVDYSLDGYDHSVLDERDNEANVPEVQLDADEQEVSRREAEDFDFANDEDIDYSLEGYDHPLVAREVKATTTSFSEADHGQLTGQIPNEENLGAAFDGDDEEWAYGADDAYASLNARAASTPRIATGPPLEPKKREAESA